MRSQNYIKNFWDKVDQSKDCWTWTASKSPSGYGQITVNEKCLRAHRFSWFIHYGEIPDGLCVLHKCDNPPCVNPNHLFLGTKRDNILDSFRKGRISMAGNNSRCRKLNQDQVNEIRANFKGRWREPVWTAIKYGVKPSTIRSLLKNKTWKIKGE